MTLALLNSMKNLSLIFVLLFSISVSAQQSSQYGNSAFNPYLINPAAGGMTNVMQYEITYRAQWTGYNGGPRTALFSGNSLIKAGKAESLGEFNYHDDKFYKLPGRTVGKTKHVIGGIAYNDAIGPFSKTSIQASYGIHLPLTSAINIGAGIGLGWSNLRVDESRVQLYNEDDLAYSQFLGSSSAYSGLDANAGLIAYSKDFVVGISTQQVLNNKVNFNDTPTESRLARHYFAHASYRFLEDNTVAIEPNFVGKFTAASPSSMDIGARLIYKNASWLNLQYRTSNALVVRVGSTLVKNLYLAYGYEVPTGKISGTASGSHEIQLGIFLGNNRNIDKEIKDSIKTTDSEEIEE